MYGAARWLSLLAMLLVLLFNRAAAAQAVRELAPEELEKAERLRQDLRAMVSLARDRVFPSLVNIKVITVRYWSGKEQKGQSVGSGTIISPDGYVVTNFHVVENGKKFQCTLSDKREVTATLVGEDPLTDLAVLKLDLANLKPGDPIQFARFGDSDTLQIGDPVMAMGSPFSLSRSVTYGIVSNTERMLTGGEDDAGEMYFDGDQRTGLFNRWIQHDAVINPGNSGGPLVNLKGEIVGVNARGGGDMGFAIPANVARSVAEALIKHGEVPRSWYGITIKSIKRTGLKEGVLVNSIVDDSPADKAGLKAGDVIVAIDGKPVTIIFAEEIPILMKEMADRPIGSSVRVTYEREGKRAEATVVTARLQKDRGDQAAFRAWGMTGEDITERMAQLRRLDSTDGVLITSVRAGSAAAQAEPPINIGDVVRRIDDTPIRNLEDLAATYRRIRDAEKTPEYLIVEYDSAGKSNLTLLKPKPDKEDDPPRELPKAWIGVATQPLLPKLAERLGDKSLVGFRITRVYPHTTAAEAGLQAGDIIRAVNDTPVVPQRLEDAGLLNRVIRKLSIDETAKLSVVRDGTTKEIEVKLERSRIGPDEARKEIERDFEMTVRELTFFDRDERRWGPEVEGVLIAGVEPAGWAGLGGLAPGDLIQRIDDKPVTDLKSFRAAMKDVAQRKPERVVFVVLRGISTNFQFVEPEWNPTVDAEHAKSGESGGETKDSKNN